MEQYNRLLYQISQRYGIIRGDHEKEEVFKSRIIYSICSMAAYTSLFDNPEGTVSVTHIKRKFCDFAENYKVMYPETEALMPSSFTDSADELFNLFLSNGIIYHSPYRVRASVKRELSCGDVLFQRGLAPDNICLISGAGFYRQALRKQVTNTADSESSDSYDNAADVKEMFGLESNPLSSVWESTVDRASFTAAYDFSSAEYLRLNPPFYEGYWSGSCEKNGKISMLRTGLKGAELYYLYRYQNGKLQTSQLPAGERNAYLARACLQQYGQLPPVLYSEDGDIVHITFQYLLPPQEMSFVKLYSWPSDMKTERCDFRRCMSAEVFKSVKQILISAGYEFKSKERL